MILETKRTTVRFFSETDYSDLYNYLSLPEIYEYEPGVPITLEEAKVIAKERQNGTNFIAVIDKDSKCLIGHFSFFSSGQEDLRTFELGYIFNPKFQGKGLATEAGKEFLEYCFQELKVHKIIANCNPNNERSWKLLERLNFEREGYLKKNIFFKKDNGKPLWVDTFMYGILSPYE